MTDINAHINGGTKMIATYEILILILFEQDTTYPL